MDKIFNQSFLGNTLEKYLIALGIFLAGLIIITIFKKVILSRLKKWSEKTKTDFDDFLVKEIEESLMPIIYFGTFLLAVNTLVLNPKISNAIKMVTAFILTFIIIKVIVSVLKYALNIYMTKREFAVERIKQLKGITSIAIFLIWSIGLLFLLDNLGVEITTVVAGLGIGGIAIALAAQSVLGDLFSYFVIFFDRPFEIGDYIVVGDKRGIVEYIGIKTTKVRSLGGELLVFRNTDLTDSRIQNFKKMAKRRIAFNLGVVYQTKAEILKEIPGIVKKIIDEQELGTYDRGHFASYGDSSLNFEFVYYVESSEYVKYMDVQQSINLKIFEEFEKKGIEFAYPTQTLFIEKNN
ncbi:MAG: mechanosensitive ion channel family protein [Bacteroidetes bacterium]|nr:mechanosensitive ion channel family protein [Bacteroidota bacterium]